VLEQHGHWASELAELRDPAAHRVPIYVPPSVITSQEQVDKFRRIEAQADAAPSERGDRLISEVCREAQAVADFAPVTIISTPQGLEIRLTGEQVWCDHDKYLTIARAVVDTLWLLPNQTLQRRGGQRRCASMVAQSEVGSDPPAAAVWAFGRPCEQAKTHGKID
jgi:hypothetical protein